MGEFEKNLGLVTGLGAGRTMLRLMPWLLAVLPSESGAIRQNGGQEKWTRMEGST